MTFDERVVLHRLGSEKLLCDTGSRGLTRLPREKGERASERESERERERERLNLLLGPSWPTRPIQGYLARKKHPPRRNLQ